MGYKPKGWGESFDFSPEMAVYFAEVQGLENSIEKGFNEKLSPVGDLGPLKSTDPKQTTVRVNDDKFHEYLSPEGGENTIAYGHKLTAAERKSGEFSKGISKPKAIDLLGEDLFEAYRGAYNQYVNQWRNLSSEQKKEKWNKLSNNAKVALTDLNFNIGNIKDYKGLFKDAVATGKVDKLKAKIAKRGYKGSEGGGFLEDRNNLINSKIGSSVRASKEVSLMGDWLSEDNLFA
tara:strand:+ start:189 stop:887 length:699 start_codon:yes stop_codon:yes gene_type:complete